MPDVAADRESVVQTLLAELNRDFEAQAEYGIGSGPGSGLRLECARLLAVADRIRQSLALPPADGEIEPRMLALMRQVKWLLAEEGRFNVAWVSELMRGITAHLYPGLSRWEHRELVQQACSRLAEHPDGQVMQYVIRNPEEGEGLYTYAFESEADPEPAPAPQWRVLMPTWLLWRAAAQALAERRPHEFTVAEMAQWLISDKWVTPDDFEARVLKAVEWLRLPHEGARVVRIGRRHSTRFRYVVETELRSGVSPAECGR